jgi:hypothetical protein
VSCHFDLLLMCYNNLRNERRAFEVLLLLAILPALTFLVLEMFICVLMINYNLVSVLSLLLQKKVMKCYFSFGHFKQDRLFRVGL